MLIQRILVIFVCSYIYSSLGFSQINLETPIFNVQSYRYEDIISKDKAASISLINSLTTVGIIQISNIPGYASSRRLALEYLSKCLSNDKDFWHQNEMDDGSLRLTIAAASTKGLPGKIPNECVDGYSYKLRTIVDHATKQLFTLLDNFASEKEYESIPLMQPYANFENVIRNGEHLEHFHLYSNPTLEDPTKATIQSHIDNGLLIAMTVGAYSKHAAPSNLHGLYIELPTNTICRAELSEDSLVIMVGGGGSNWLSPVLGEKLRAVPHALVAGLTSEESYRSWYGKMFLPPLDAVIDSSTGLTYGAYKLNTVVKSATFTANDLPTGCEIYQDYRKLSKSSDSFCKAGEVYCWMQCMSTANLPCGDAAVCYDSSVDAPNNGDITCPSTCSLQCMSSDSTNSTSTFDGYCYGMGVSMNMDGFSSIATSSKGSTACVNLLFTSWTLDNSTKFAFACIGVFLLSIGVHYFTYLRRILLKKAKVKSVYLQSLLTLLHGMQVTLGYLLMLVAMTYSVELFCVVCSGSTVGFGIFNFETNPTSIDQCCDFEDQKEQESSLLIFHAKA